MNVKRAILRVVSFLQILQGYRTLLAMVMFGIAWAVKKAVGLDVQPSTLLLIQGAVLGGLSTLPSRPRKAWVTRTIVILGIAQGIVGGAFQANPKWAASVMKYAPVEAPVPEPADAGEPVELPVIGAEVSP